MVELLKIKVILKLLLKKGTKRQTETLVLKPTKSRVGCGSSLGFCFHFLISLWRVVLYCLIRARLPAGSDLPTLRLHSL